MLRPVLPRIGNSLRTFRRSLHHVPSLGFELKDGVPGLLSPAGFNIAWTQYQTFMIEKLNTLTAGMPIQNSHLSIQRFSSFGAERNALPSRMPLEKQIEAQRPAKHNTNDFIQERTPHPNPRKMSSSNTPAIQTQPRYSTTPQWPSTTTSSSKASPRIQHLPPPLSSRTLSPRSPPWKP